MNILKNYNQTITKLSKKDQIEYINNIKQNLDSELFELIIDITIQFDQKIQKSLKGTKREHLFDKLNSILDNN